MLKAILLVMLALCGVSAHAGERNVLAPYRFEPPPRTLSPVEQQRALDYRNQVQSQLRQLERQRARGPFDPRQEQRLMETRGEFDRMKRILEP